MPEVFYLAEVDRRSTGRRHGLSQLALLEAKLKSGESPELLLQKILGNDRSRALLNEAGCSEWEDVSNDNLLLFIQRHSEYDRKAKAYNPKKYKALILLLLHRENLTRKERALGLKSLAELYLPVEDKRHTLDSSHHQVDLVVALKHLVHAHEVLDNNDPQLTSAIENLAQVVFLQCSHELNEDTDIDIVKKPYLQPIAALQEDVGKVVPGEEQDQSLEWLQKAYEQIDALYQSLLPRVPREGLSDNTIFNQAFKQDIAGRRQFYLMQTVTELGAVSIRVSKEHADEVVLRYLNQASAYVRQLIEATLAQVDINNPAELTHLCQQYAGLHAAFPRTLLNIFSRFINVLNKSNSSQYSVRLARYLAEGTTPLADIIWEHIQTGSPLLIKANVTEAQMTPSQPFLHALAVLETQDNKAFLTRFIASMLRVPLQKVTRAESGLAGMLVEWDARLKEYSYTRAHLATLLRTRYQDEELAHCMQQLAENPSGQNHLALVALFKQRVRDPKYPTEEYRSYLQLLNEWFYYDDLFDDLPESDRLVHLKRVSVDYKSNVIEDFCRELTDVNTAVKAEIFNAAKLNINYADLDKAQAEKDLLTLIKQHDSAASDSTAIFARYFNLYLNHVQKPSAKFAKHIRLYLASVMKLSEEQIEIPFFLHCLLILNKVRQTHGMADEATKRAKKLLIKAVHFARTLWLEQLQNDMVESLAEQLGMKTVIIEEDDPFVSHDEQEHRPDARAYDSDDPFEVTDDEPFGPDDEEEELSLARSYEHSAPFGFSDAESEYATSQDESDDDPFKGDVKHSPSNGWADEIIAEEQRQKAEEEQRIAEEITTACTDYISWSQQHVKGLKHLYHGNSGIRRAQEILTFITEDKSDNKHAELMVKVNKAYQASSYHKHSLSRFLYKALHKADESSSIHEKSDKTFKDMKRKKPRF